MKQYEIGIDAAKRGYRMDNHNTYVQILINTLIKKKKILDDLIETTLSQEISLKNLPQDMDSFENSLDKKAELIESLNQLDAGFDTVYERVKKELVANKERYHNEILKLQELIRQTTERSIKLQALEQQNKMKIEVYFSHKKKEIKNFKKSSQTASNYYKSMIDHHQGESHFLDKKK